MTKTSRANRCMRFLQSANFIRVQLSDDAPLLLLHEFETIAERIIDEDAPVTFEGRVVDYCESSFSAPFNDCLQVTDQQTGMCLGCGMKVFVDAEMDLDAIGFEPAPTPLGKARRFGRFRKA